MDETIQIVALHLHAAQNSHREQTWHYIDDSRNLTGEIFTPQDQEGYESFKANALERYISEPFFKMRVDKLIESLSLKSCSNPHS